MSNETKKCQFCGEDILAVAVKCKHCGSMLDGSSLGASTSEEVLADVAANFLRGMESGGGRLKITNRRVLFDPLVLNLQQNPRAVVKIGTDELTVQARTASPEERERLWVGITATYSGYGRYQEKTARQIPVLILTPDRAGPARVLRRRVAGRTRASRG